ncbi:MAG: VWA domain-containing protein, partial [Deltaproteobacteria bacterium]|nr:VWA domain-containing protein [Deltaproteobacteria bacterium]
AHRARLGLPWALAVLAFALPFVLPGCVKEPPLTTRTQPMQARLELAAGEVAVEMAGKAAPAYSGTALLQGATVRTGKGSRALVRLSDGSALFLRGGTSISLQDSAVDLQQGEIWLDSPPSERRPMLHRLGRVLVLAADAGLSLRRFGEDATIYVARGLATVTSSGGRVEVSSGEQASLHGDAPPTLTPVAFWEDWTGGLADRGAVPGLGSSGSGRIYGVDLGAPAGSPARKLEVSRQAVRAVLRFGLAETEVDQIFFNPGDRPVEGWYWFAVPGDASVTGFAVETNGVLVEGEFIERKEAAAQYGRAIQSGHEPALLEWVDSRTFRARIYPVPAMGSRRVVLRYQQLLGRAGGELRYLYPLQSSDPVRIGEFSLQVDLGEEGRKMALTTLADARVEEGGRRVTMRRSGYTPRADFVLEARLPPSPAAISAARFSMGGETADYVMLRHVPDLDWTTVKELRGEIVVVVDTSAASDETTRTLQTTTAEAILRSLAAEDRFALVSLDVRPKVIYPRDGLAPAGEKEIAQAMEGLAEHASGGATDLSALFDVALSRLHASEQPALVYIGDGIATSGEIGSMQLLERLRRALSTSRARFFTVAVGAHAQRTLLATLARTGGGQTFAVGEAEEATEQALQLVAALKTPTITDLELELGEGLDGVFLSANGKVSSGDEVIVLARTHQDLPEQVTVRGRLGGQPFSRSYRVVEQEGPIAGFVPRLWAAEAVRRLLGTADPEAERGKIMTLGLTYGLMTPYNSILALESEAAFAAQGIPRKRDRLRGLRLASLGAEGSKDASKVVQVSSGGQRVPGMAAPETAPVPAPAPPSMEEYDEAAKEERYAAPSPRPALAVEALVKEPAPRPPPPAPASMAAMAGLASPVGGAAYGGLATAADQSVVRSGAAGAKGRRSARYDDDGTARLDNAFTPPPSPAFPSRRQVLVQTCSDIAQRPLHQRSLL